LLPDEWLPRGGLEQNTGLEQAHFEDSRRRRGRAGNRLAMRDYVGLGASGQPPGARKAGSLRPCARALVKAPENVFRRGALMPESIRRLDAMEAVNDDGHRVLADELFSSTDRRK